MIFMVHLHLLSTTVALLANVTNIINFKASSNVKFTIGYGIQNPFIGENVDLSDTRFNEAYLNYANSVGHKWKGLSENRRVSAEPKPYKQAFTEPFPTKANMLGVDIK